MIEIKEPLRDDRLIQNPALQQLQLLVANFQGAIGLCEQDILFAVAVKIILNRGGQDGAG
ncbi:MAG: hypothetical protein BWY83_01171 [bacterium ADurb.Bin478]|nr:MAG: hypothetical protein BWY83_01171 [bacterium ADurb.Bin478]